MYPEGTEYVYNNFTPRSEKLSPVLEHLRKGKTMSTESKTIATPIPGQPWPKQGGIYVGTRVIDGAVVHIIAAPGVEHDIVGVPFAQVEAVIPAELNGHSDWRAPDHKDLMLAFVNARDCFVHNGADSIYWTKSEHHGWSWAVDFELGYVDDDFRRHEFRVRPFRSIIASSI